MSHSLEVAPSAVIFGCIDTVLTPDEVDLFSTCNPFGLILFEHNCINPIQLADLILQFRETVGRDDAPVLIDQEGGRVTRMKAPHWREPPPANTFAQIAKNNIALASRAAYLNARLIGKELAQVGITVDCLPVLDIPNRGAHEVIGDRALGENSTLVEELGRALSEGLMAEAVLPVIKHIPGHGRAKSDSHKELPVVNTRLKELEVTDFLPFERLNEMPWAMTAHVVYEAIDPINAATISPIIIKEIIRDKIKFKGLLLSDDIGMEALSGTKGERALKILEAGCDLTLECSGKIEDMTEVASIIPAMKEEAIGRAIKAEELRQQKLIEDGLTYEEILEELKNILWDHQNEGA